VKSRREIIAFPVLFKIQKIQFYQHLLLIKVIYQTPMCVWSYFKFLHKELNFTT